MATNHGRSNENRREIQFKGTYVKKQPVSLESAGKSSDYSGEKFSQWRKNRNSSALAQVEKINSSQKKSAIFHERRNIQSRSNTSFIKRDKNWKLTNLFTLINLLEKDETEILFTLLLDDSGFQEVLNKNTFEREMMSVILNLISKASQSSHQANVQSLLHVVMINRHFILHVQRYLLFFHKTLPEGTEVMSILNFATFLQKFQTFEPSNSTDIVLILLPLLTLTFDILSSHGIEMEKMRELLSEIKKQQDIFLEKIVVKKWSCMQNNELQCYNQPPENYRSLPILPTVDDINDIPFLRANIISGKYMNAEHYLDVQFRLLREDYIQPLRSGIQQYLSLCESDKFSGKTVKHLQDIYIYNDFQILYPSYNECGIVYIARFNIAPFSHIHWEDSKRFLTGGLLCFSDDKFQSFHLASVANRDTGFLRQGLLIIKCESISPEILSYNPSKMFVMIETPAYFEAYRHNLGALIEMNEKNLPLQKYIVQTEKVVEEPKYLSKTSVYRMKCVPRHVFVLKEKDWPSKEEFGLDNSQYAALKSAITKEFSIIQGPPGTGKTFIGLKIMEILLHNKYISSPSSPILVVCYTNHALDQFLEGMLHYTNNIARVGGRCSSELLSDYQLKNLRKEKRKLFPAPKCLRKILAFKYEELNALKKTIQSYSNKLHSCAMGIQDDIKLYSVMSRTHFQSLTQEFNHYDGKNLLVWLGLRDFHPSQFNPMYAEEEFYKEYIDHSKIVQNKSESLHVKENNKSLEVDCEDVDRLEALRSIDYDCIDINMKNLNINANFDEETKSFTYPWKSSGKNYKKFVQNMLNSSKPLTSYEANKIINIWNLTISERWSLYVYWQQLYMHYLSESTNEYLEKLHKIQTELQEMRNEEDIWCLHRCDVVGMTTTGAAKYRNVLKRLKPKIVIVEEAAEVLESHIITSLTQDTQHVILIGDHQQLRPPTTVYELAKKFNFDVSLFERMVNNGMECHRLNIQHRMRPCIATLLTPHIYSDLQNHESVLNLENIKGISKNVFFVNHCEFEYENSELKSHVNQHEAKFIIELCIYLIKQGYSPSQVTILTTYTGQLLVIKQLMRGNSILDTVRATVVDNYQGEENDIILISFVRSNDYGKIGFLQTSNRVCVALSRAKNGLYCIGNFQFLSENSKLWRKILKKLTSFGNIGSSVELCCQIHPSRTINVATGEDFHQAPDGGCLLPCGKELSCGHICLKKCHPTDLDHIEYQCKEKCPKILCENNHKCPHYCYEKCGPCKVPVPKIILICGHVVCLPCHEEPKHSLCNFPCKTMLRCGHQCTRKCGERCLEQCMQEVQFLAPCGHHVIIKCFLKSDLGEVQKACIVKCTEILPCGHICSGCCGKCYTFEMGIRKLLHIKCNKDCHRTLVCGHRCKKMCGEDCGNCYEIVSKTYSCGHKRKTKCYAVSLSKCNKQCFAILPCSHICEGNCFVCKNGISHKPCKQKIERILNCGHKLVVCCSDPSPQCKARCNKTLICGHKCLKSCSVPCEKKCSVVVTKAKLCGHYQSYSCYEGEIECRQCNIIDSSDDSYDYSYSDDDLY